MLKLRYLLRLAWTFIVRFRNVLILGIAVGVILFFSLRILAPLIIPSRSENIAIVGKYRLNALPSEILQMIGNGLTKVDESGTVLPDLASSWETPDSGQTWIFHLKDNTVWQDGKKVTANSIVYEFSDATIERPDDKTIVFKLLSPFAPFPAIVSQPTFRKGLLGTGEWKVVKASVAGSFVQKLTLENKKGTRKIVKLYPTEDRAKLAFKLGAVNKLEDIFDPTPFEDWTTINITKDFNKNRFVAVFLNTRDKLMAEKSLRQALNYAVNKDILPGPRAYGPISPNSWAYNPQVKPYDYDTQKAMEIIEDLPKEIKDNLSIGLVTSPVLLSTAETIANNWRAIGVTTRVQVTSGIPSEYQAFLAIFDIPKDPDQYSIWHSTQAVTNISKYQNPRIDKLLEDGRVQLDTELRRQIYLDFQRFLVEDSPAIFLYHPFSFTVERK